MADPLDKDPIIKDEDEESYHEEEYEENSYHSEEDRQDYQVPQPPQNDDVPDFESNPGLLKNMTTEQLQELLRKVRERDQMQEQKDLNQKDLDDLQDDDEEQRERQEELHPNGERLIDDSLDDQISKVLYELAQYRTNIIYNEEDLEEAADKFVELNSLLLQDEGKKIFEMHKGLELLMILYKVKGQSNLRSFIIKSLDYAFSNNQSLSNKFVDMLGLPLIFAFFMKKESADKKKKKNKKWFIFKQSEDEKEEDDYHCLSIIANMLICCSKVNFDRCFYKFIENSFEKTERLVELYKHYFIKIREEPEGSDDDDNNRYLTLQIISFIMIFLCPKLFKNLEITRDSDEYTVTIINKILIIHLIRKKLLCIL